MKTFNLKGLALILAVLAGLNVVTAQTSQEVTSPKIVFDDLTYSFGTINVGDKGEFEVSFKNEGAEPLIVKGVQGCCGAKVLEYTKDPILSGKSGSLKLQIYTGGVGAVSKTITVTSNDPQNPVVRVRFTGNIKAAE